MNALPLTLNQGETMLLTDRVQNTALDDNVPIGKPFLLKLASAYLELVGDKTTTQTVTVFITEREAWLARSLFNSGDRTATDNLAGVHLLRKLYAILLRFNADEVDALPDADAGDKSFAEMPKAKHINDPDADLSEYDGLAGAL